MKEFEAPIDEETEQLILKNEEIKSIIALMYHNHQEIQLGYIKIALNLAESLSRDKCTHLCVSISDSFALTQLFKPFGENLTDPDQAIRRRVAIIKRLVNFTHPKTHTLSRN